MGRKVEPARVGYRSMKELRIFKSMYIGCGVFRVISETWPTVDGEWGYFGVLCYTIQHNLTRSVLRKVKVLFIPDCVSSLDSARDASLACCSSSTP